jgi:hypothetical protein
MSAVVFVTSILEMQTALSGGPSPVIPHSAEDTQGQTPTSSQTVLSAGEIGAGAEGPLPAGTADPNPQAQVGPLHNTQDGLAQ